MKGEEDANASGSARGHRRVQGTPHPRREGSSFEHLNSCSLEGLATGLPYHASGQTGKEDLEEVPSRGPGSSSAGVPASQFHVKCVSQKEQENSCVSKKTGKQIGSQEDPHLVSEQTVAVTSQLNKTKVILSVLRLCVVRGLEDTAMPVGLIPVLTSSLLCSSA